MSIPMHSPTTLQLWILQSWCTYNSSIKQGKQQQVSISLAREAISMRWWHLRKRSRSLTAKKILQEFNQIIKRQEDCGVRTGLDRKVRWQNGTTEAAAEVGNECRLAKHQLTRRKVHAGKRRVDVPNICTGVLQDAFVKAALAENNSKMSTKTKLKRKVRYIHEELSVTRTKLAQMEIVEEKEKGGDTGSSIVSEYNRILCHAS